jgi:hypothetical protein
MKGAPMPRKSTAPPQAVIVDATVAVVTTKVFFNILQAARFSGVSPYWIEEICRQDGCRSDGPGTRE